MFSDADYRALTTAAGYVDRRDRGVLRVTGADRASWLQGLLTNDVDALRPGEAGYAAYLTPQGRMISDMRVIVAPDAIVLDVPAELAAPLRGRMDGLIFAEDVRIDNAGPATAVVELHGPGAPAAAEGLQRADLPDVVIVRDTQAGVPGWVVYVPRDAMAALSGELARLGVPEVSMATLEVLRIEAGIPRFLADMTEDTIPLEAGIEDRAISFTKGCYVGQEIIVRVVHRGGGRVARKLVGLAFAGDDAAVAGDRVMAGDREVGRVTSAAWSPALGHVVALGYVHRDFVEPGTRLEIMSGDRRLSAVVSDLPFVHR